MFTEYTIIGAPTIERLIEAVNFAIKNQNRQPVGGVTTVQSGFRPGVEGYIQAMAK